MVTADKALCACGCGTEIALIGSDGRRRRFAHGHNGRGEPRSGETLARISAANRGKHPSAEARALMAAAARGRPKSAETRAKLSAATRGRGLGEKNPAWKGGRRTTVDGYVQVRCPDHPASNAQGYVLEHILVYEAAHGPLPKGHVVHHKNGDRQDNRDENLEAMTRTGHMSLHRRLTKERR